MAKSPPLLRVALDVDGAQVERAIAAWELAGVHNSSVEYRLPPGEEPPEEPWPGPQGQADSAEVVAYLTAERWAAAEPHARRAAQSLLGSRQLFRVTQVPERDWRTAWHEFFDLVRIPGEPLIVIRPPHREYRSRPGEVVIELAPGLAFGTGQHQSTRLCLRLLRESAPRGARVLDVGTGSGILAVAAVKLGAGSVLATDIDPLAVDAARQTARRNAVGDRVAVRETSVPPSEVFDLVLANLTADLLQHLAQDLAAAVGPDGRLIASGLIAPRQAEVAAAMAAQGLRLLAAEAEDEWRGLVFARA